VNFEEMGAGNAFQGMRRLGPYFIGGADGHVDRIRVSVDGAHVDDARAMRGAAEREIEQISNARIMSRPFAEW